MAFPLQFSTKILAGHGKMLLYKMLNYAMLLRWLV